MATTEDSLTYEAILEKDGLKVSKSPWGAEDEIGRSGWGHWHLWGMNNEVHSLDAVAHLLGDWRAPVFESWSSAGWFEP